MHPSAIGDRIHVGSPKIDSTAPTGTHDLPSARQLLLAALGVGALGDSLLRGGSLSGIGPALWFLFAITTLTSLTTDNANPPSLQRRLLLGSMGVLAALFMVRDAEGLTALMFVTLAALTILSVAVVRGQTIRDLRDLPLVDTLLSAIRVIIATLSGAVSLVFRDFRAEEGTVSRFRNKDAIIRGLVITIPIAFIFIALFASADSTFANFVGAFKLDIGELLSHLVVTAVLTWLAAGLLRHAAHGEGVASTRLAPIQALGSVEVGMLLGTLTFVFTIFVALQLPRMFAGEDYIIRESGLTYASYARRGFFELVFASGLTLAVLAGLRSVVQLQDGTLRLLRIMGGVLVALVFVILQSAIHRFALYVDAYGWSEDRIFAIAIIAWLGVCFSLSFGTLLGRRPERFIGGAVAAALVTLFSLIAVNPQATTIQLNARRAQTTGTFDLGYVGRAFGRDAAPALAKVLPTLPANLSLEKRDCDGLNGFLNRLDAPTDWRAWTISSKRAETSKAAIETWRARHCGAQQLTPARQPAHTS